MLRIQFKMEMIVYSQDRTYSSSLSDRKKEEDEEEDKRKSMKYQKERSLLYSRDSNATLQELMLHLKSYYKVSFNLEQRFMNKNNVSSF